MATSESFITFVCEQIRGDYAVRYKKMFGEYMVYVNDKPVLLVCDDCVYVKKLPQLAALLQDADVGVPYDGAKEHYVLDVEDADTAAAVIRILEQITPVPKKKTKEKRAESEKAHENI